MPVRLSTLQPSQNLSVPSGAAAPSQRPRNSGIPEGGSEGVPWARYGDVLKRNIPLILVLTTVGSALGLYAATRVNPVYEAQATIWVSAAAGERGGSQQLLTQTSWVDLLRSFAIVDPVVHDLKLNVLYQPLDSTLFKSFASGPSLRPGSYVLTVNENAQGYVLSTAKGATLGRGMPGDSIGKDLGFYWAPDARLLSPGRVVPFTVARLRSTSAGLIANMRGTLPDDGQFLTLALSGSDPERTARTVNAWAEKLVSSAIELKKHHLLEYRKILGSQLAVAERELRSSEIQLERFRVNTITLPSGGAPLAGGVEVTRNSVITNYFQQKQSLEEVRNDRSALERMIAEANGGVLNTQAFLLLPSILNNTPQLRSAIEELSSRQASLRTEQQYLTDANPRIKQLNETVRVLENETIPKIAQLALASLRARERELSGRIETQSGELRSIPPRTIEEMRLVREVAASENLYNTIKSKYEDVSFAEAQTTPDLRILDFAATPTSPSSNDGPRLLLVAVLASLGLAIGIALFRDRIDPRFRYPHEATHQLGLVISGMVPRFRINRRGELPQDTMLQAVESFRTLRLAVRYEFPDESPIVVSIASPGPGDGKSLVSSNLALAFATAGLRTLLIDGDVRCGRQHGTFALPISPGLVDFLSGSATIDDVVMPTSSENLYLLACGTRRNRAPELLVSDQMAALVRVARQHFDAVVIDSPPFVAGVDAYALGAAAGSMLVVLRPGVSDRKLTAAKLEIVDRLPIRVLGAVLNGVMDEGPYRYYFNDYSYAEANAKDSTGGVAAPKGLALRA